MAAAEVRCQRCNRKLRGAASKRLGLGTVCRRAAPALAYQLELEAQGQQRLFPEKETTAQRCARLAQGFKKWAPGPIAALQPTRKPVK